VADRAEGGGARFVLSVAEGGGGSLLPLRRKGGENVSLRRRERKGGLQPVGGGRNLIHCGEGSFSRLRLGGRVLDGPVWPMKGEKEPKKKKRVLLRFSPPQKRKGVSGLMAVPRRKRKEGGD